jgi:hypothetical protein
MEKAKFPRRHYVFPNVYLMSLPSAAEHFDYEVFSRLFDDGLRGASAATEGENDLFFFFFLAPPAAAAAFLLTGTRPPRPSPHRPAAVAAAAHRRLAEAHTGRRVPV